MKNNIPRNTLAAFLTVLVCSLQLNAQYVKYPALSQSRVIIHGDSGKWDANQTHTLSVVEANKDGYKYWGYYGLSYYFFSGGGDLNLLKAGLVRSNDLIHWHKYKGNPIIDDNCRWPNVTLVGSTFYMFYTEYDQANDSRIVMVTSKDGIHFRNKVVVVPRERGMQDQNPFIYFDKRSKEFCLFYYNGIEKSRDSTSDYWSIMLRESGNISGLRDANQMVLLLARHTMAAPSICYYRGRYFLLVESRSPKEWDNRWVTLAYSSKRIDGKYIPLKGAPVVRDNDACAFQYVFGNRLYIFYSHCIDTVKSYWELKMTRAAR